MTPYQTAERWLLAEGLFDATLEELAIDGRSNREGIAFFLGRHHGTQAHLTHLLKLRGIKLNKTPDHLRVDPDLMNEVTDLAIAEDVSLLGQIHSHGPGHGIDLSYPDHFHGIRVQGFLSLVAPDFALRPHTGLLDCGVHVFEASKGYRRMLDQEIKRRFALLDGVRHRALVVSS